jgi:CubicO group peptidase (beta-lactamase class C family)
MTKRGRGPVELAFAVIAASVLSCERAPPRSVAAAPDYWPTEGWRSSTPEAQGIDSRALAAFVRSVRARRLAVHGVLVIRGGSVVLDASFFPYERGGLHDVASVTKSITSTLVGIAVRERLLGGVRQPIGRAMPGDRRAPTADGVTVEHLLTMTSGVSCGQGPGGELAETLAMQRSADWLQFALERPRPQRPGAAFAYCNSSTGLVVPHPIRGRSRR